MATASFQNPVNRIKREDLFMSLALWMEESPLAMSDSTFCNRTKDDNFYDQQANSNAIREFCEPARKKIRAELLTSSSQFAGSEDDKIFDGLLDPYSRDDGKAVELEIESSVEATSNEKGISGNQRAHKVGTVFVTHDGEILALDCSRNGVHGIVNVLVDFHDRVKNCNVYVSRKPCSSCVKLVIHSEISRVFYLPLTPENPAEEDLQNTDRLSRVCAIGQSIYIPQIGEDVMAQSYARNSPYTAHKQGNLNSLNLLNKYWNDKWISQISKKLRWPEFESLKEETSTLMRSFLQWIFSVTYCDVPQSIRFNAWIPEETPLASKNANSTLLSEDFPQSPDPNNAKWQELARHWSRLAQILSQHADDPRRGVGAVVVSKNQVVAMGWNSYPPKTNYGDFPRASDNDPECFQPKKYPFLVHAEQAAVLSRNTSSISHTSTTLFVSKKPCDECVALLIKTGIKSVVFPKPNPKRFGTYLKYNLLREMVQQGKIKGFQSTQQERNNHDDGESSKHETCPL